MRTQKNLHKWKRFSGLILVLLILLSPVLELHGFAADGASADSVQSALEQTGSDAEVSGPEESTEPTVSPAQGTGQPEPEGGEYGTVTLHDMDPDGSEILPASGEILTVTVPADSTLLSAFEDQNVTVGTDGEAAKKCRWYTLDDYGKPQRYEDLDQTLSGDLELYTYSYRLNVYGAAEDDAASSLLKSVTEREALPIPADKLVSGGVDLTTLQWTDQASGETVDAAALMASGLEKNMAVLVSGEDTGAVTGDGAAEAAADDTATVYCYVALNGSWHLVKTLYTSNRGNYWGGSNLRFYLTANQLKEVYGDYGFTDTNLENKRIFPHTDNNDRSLIWADALPTQVNGTWLVPISFRTENYLYYMPGNVPGSAYYFTQSIRAGNADVIADNSFYTVSVSDPQNAFAGSTLPAAQTVASGSTCSVTVPTPTSSSVVWRIRNALTLAELTAGTDYTVTHNGDNTCTYTFPAVTCPIRLTAVDPNAQGYTLKYQAAIEDSMVKLGVFYSSDQQIVTDGTVDGQAVYEEQGITGNYTVRAPDTECAEVLIPGTRGNGRHFFYTFTGWQLGTSDTVLQPGDTITAAQLEDYAATDNLTLKAVWTGKDVNTRTASVNFYVNLTCEVMDTMDNGFDSQPASNFTSAVYACRIFGTDSVKPGTSRPDDNCKVLAPPTSETTAYDVDSQLRACTQTPINGSITMDTFPTDESIFAKLRASNAKIQLDGVTIPVDHLTSDNFTIRWYVLKYDKGDGWHVDGILVAKQGRIVVKKTFAGDSEAIAEVADEGYSIAVSHTESGAEKTDYTLTLNPAEEEAAEGMTGYTSFDQRTNTYIWVLNARQGRTYTVREQNYQADTERWNNTAQFMITNSQAETNGWLNYTDDGVTVTAEAYPSDIPAEACQTVAFQNLYVQSGLLTIHKIDSNTGNGLSGVSFRLSMENGNALTLYRKPGTSQYSTDSAAQAAGYTQVVSDNTMVTDANGYIYVRLAIQDTGSVKERYYLKESVPTGYEGPKKILVQISDDGVIELASEVESSSLDSNEGWLEGENTAILTIKNRSKLLTTVTAQKDWGNTAQSVRQPVTVQLWCNGAKMVDRSGQDSYTQVLSDDNNWKFVWEDLPLFIDGQLAEYSLREVYIGDIAYDPQAGEDGYSEYLVSYDAPRYREGEGSGYNDDAVWQDAGGVMHYANHVLLVVHNSEAASGLVTFVKVDEKDRPLKNAVFGLYSGKECEDGQLLDQAVSDSGGTVSFSNKLTTGTYYLKEISAPEHYITDDTVFTVRVRGRKAEIFPPDSTTPLTRISNTSAMMLTIQKTDENGAPLTGAVFELWADSKLYGSYTVDSLGQIHISNLPDDDYMLREVEAPSGYAVRKDEVGLRVRDGEITLIGTAVSGVALEKDEDPENEYSFYLTVENFPIYALPTSGGRGIGVPALLGTLLMCLAASGVILYQRKRRGSHNM